MEETKNLDLNELNKLGELSKEDFMLRIPRSPAQTTPDHKDTDTRVQSMPTPKPDTEDNIGRRLAEYEIPDV